ncbi:hypothetical protein CCACVL1_23681 [Corchorus capsularis]|uniref:non-specific serine/threonine protein kinase n=1 Tax=Corchorus capsularis TaxID=210143 RepID=A0A1R3GT81_COCAP|nr:hypothetical protein CCACVL1_23681 [Corchorus capsularis]
MAVGRLSNITYANCKCEETFKVPLIVLNPVIITAGTNESWKSPSGDFAFGFYQTPGGGYLVGIWFDKIPETGRTLVWSANRDSPAEAGSTIQIKEGQLLLSYSNGTQQPIYSGDEPGNSGLMQDDGNFVLMDANSLPVWRSYDSPTDTLLPGQDLSNGRTLLSNAKGTADYSTGNFRLQMQGDGLLSLLNIRFVEPQYWLTDNAKADNQNVRLVFNNQTALMYLANATGHIILPLTRNIPNPVEDYYHRATIDDNGNFQQYVYHRRNGTAWTRVWRAVEEPCNVTSVCGLNGMCTSMDNETLTCSCIPGYTHLDPSDPVLGCHPVIPVNYCKDPSMKDFTVEVIDDADFPCEEQAELSIIENVDLEGCKIAVMEDCYTLAASLEGSTCYKKRMPLLKARKSASSIGIKALIKVPMNLTTPGIPQGEKKKNFNFRLFLKISLILSVTLAFLLGASAIYYLPAFRRLIRRKSYLNLDAVGVGFRQFTFQELFEATNGFSKTLGRGSSAKVYRGLLNLQGVQIEIAVKKLEKEIEKSKNEFMTELKIIGRTHHRNLVRLLGFCIEKNQQLLVYELMAKGPLSRSLFGEEERPNWFQRAEMALGIARGLLYLHEECETQIIHCDIKPQNVLLDENYTAKIADFGLSKLLNKDQTRTDTKVRGTMGYLAPEWLKHAPVNAKVDVFSFGVMLLEIICCRRHIEDSRVEEESEMDDLVLSDWIISCIKSGKLGTVVGHDPEVLSDFKRFQRMAMVGLWCIYPDPILRPSMKKVTQMLEGAMEVGVPPLLHDHQFFSLVFRFYSFSLKATMAGTRIFAWILLLLCFLIGSSAQTTNNTIELGSSITAGSNSSWRSASADFAFGFYLTSRGLYLVGIWFDKIPKKTLVWSANRDDPAQNGSTIDLTLDGQLVLTHSNSTKVTIFNGTSTSSALMQDNGNFILRDSSSRVIWESFDFPTDTILLGQSLVMGQKLYSNADGTVDYSTGRYRLEVQLDGNIVLSAFRFADEGYWNTITSGRKNVSLVFNESTTLMSTVSDGSIIWTYNDSQILSPTRDYYHRAMVNDLGNFQQLIYHKESGSQWTVVWEAIKEPCIVNNVCGVFGFCTSPDNNMVKCECLPGYSPRDPNNPSKGCFPDVTVDFCAPESSASDFTINQIDGADFPSGGWAELERIEPTDVNECKNKVMEDCFCVAAVLNGTTCIKMRMPLLNGRKSDPSTNNKVAFIKVPNTNTTSPGKDKKDFPSTVSLLVGLILCLVLVVLFAAILIYNHPFTQPYIRLKPPPNPEPVEISLKAFSFQELHEATNGFKNRLGQGAFGTVYSGVITSEDENIEVAVKQLEKVIEQGEKEFLTEVRVIGLTHHKNLVRLVGFCNEKNHRLLVYELMKNGTLYSFLFGEVKPSWDQRADTVFGIARGLLYLHEECETQIIHCDIKPQNVLLDDSFTAKIADFGLAKLMMKDQTKTSTNVRGTMGYMAPEWLKNAPITTKVDVYSFGVLLLEIVFCRRHIELNQVEGEITGDEMILIDWVLHSVRVENLSGIVSHDYEVLSDFNRFERMVMVGLWCICPNPTLRPSMKTVMQMMEGTTEVGVPPLLDAPF